MLGAYLDVNSALFNVIGYRYFPNEGQVEFNVENTMSDVEYTTLSNAVNSFTNDWILPKTYRYDSKVLSETNIADTIYRSVFSWIFNGTDAEPSFHGIRLTAHIDPSPTDTAPPTYDIRIFDVENKKVIKTMTLGNTSDSNIFVGEFQDLRTNPSMMEVHARKGNNGSQISLTGLHFIYEA